jgi:COMPASS component SWD1
MNLALLDSELFELPEMIEDRLQVSPDEVVVCTFNGRGNLLAGGCLKGTVVVWDFDTHGVARTLLGHAGRVTGVHWTRSSRKLLSGSADGKLIVWDVLNSTALQTVDMGGEVLQAALHPRRRAVCLACVGTGAASQAFLVSLLPGAEQRVALLPQTDVAEAPAGQEAAAASGETSAGAEAPKARRDAVAAACFDREGSHALVGTSRGAVHLIRVDSREVVASVQLPGGAAIKSLVLSRNGKSFVANSSDRIIRACSLERMLAGEKAAPRELQDVVNRVQVSAPRCT